MKAFSIPEKTNCVSPGAVEAQLLAMFRGLDARGQKTTLAMLAVAVKLHPKVGA